MDIRSERARRVASGRVPHLMVAEWRAHAIRAGQPLALADDLRLRLDVGVCGLDRFHPAQSTPVSAGDPRRQRISPGAARFGRAGAACGPDLLVLDATGRLFRFQLRLPQPRRRLFQPGAGGLLHPGHLVLSPPSPSGRTIQPRRGVRSPCGRDRGDRPFFLFPRRHAADGWLPRSRRHHHRPHRLRLPLFRSLGAHHRFCRIGIFRGRGP